MNLNQWKVSIQYNLEGDVQEVKTFQASTFFELRSEIISHLLSVNAQSMECGNVKIRKTEGQWKIYSQGHWFPLAQQTLREVSTLFAFRLSFEKGDGYQDRAMVDGVFQLGAIRTVDRIHDIDQVNRRLVRGWYILALPTELGMDFTLGHTEENAI